MNKSILADILKYLLKIIETIFNLNKILNHSHTSTQYLPSITLIIKENLNKNNLNEDDKIIIKKINKINVLIKHFIKSKHYRKNIYSIIYNSDVNINNLIIHNILQNKLLILIELN